MTMTDPTLEALDGQDLTPGGFKDGFTWKPPEPSPDEVGHVVDPAWLEEPWVGQRQAVRS